MVCMLARLFRPYHSATAGFARSDAQQARQSQSKNHNTDDGQDQQPHFGRFHHWIHLDQRRTAASYMDVETMETERQPLEATMLRMFAASERHKTSLPYLYSVLDCNLSKDNNNNNSLISRRLALLPKRLLLRRRPYTVCCRFKAKSDQFGAKSGLFHHNTTPFRIQKASHSIDNGNSRLKAIDIQAITEL